MLLVISTRAITLLLKLVLVTEDFMAPEHNVKNAIPHVVVAQALTPTNVLTVLMSATP